MRNVISLLFILILGLIISASSRAQSVTITGTVKDSITQLPIDSATVVLVNERNPTERYSVITDASGNWSYMFQSTGVIARTDIPTNLVLGQNYPNPSTLPQRSNSRCRHPAWQGSPFTTSWGNSLMKDPFLSPQDTTLSIGEVKEVPACCSIRLK